MALSFRFAMNRVEQKRKARQVRSKAARNDRFISLYVMRKHKDVYEQAKKFYQQLDEKYPFKRDLTKTDEFVQETTEYTSAYCSAQAKYQAKKSNSQEAKGMTLEITLMNQSDVDIAVMEEKVDQSLAIPEHVYNDLLMEIAKDPVMNSIFNNIDIEQPQENDEQQELNLFLDERVDILPNESSPLEQELENLVCQ